MSSAASHMDDQSRFQAFERKGLLTRAAPFLGAMWLAIMGLPAAARMEGRRPSSSSAVILNTSSTSSSARSPSRWHRLPHFAQILPPVRVLRRDRSPPRRGRRQPLGLCGPARCSGPSSAPSSTAPAEQLAVSMVSVAPSSCCRSSWSARRSTDPASGPAPSCGSASPRSWASRCSRSSASCATAQTRPEACRGAACEPEETRKLVRHSMAA